MSLRSIRDSYAKLLTAVDGAGIKLNESQKEDLDTFVLAVEESMSKQRESAIRKTKKLVTEKLEAEFKTVFDSIFKTLQENNALASKIEKMSTKMQESKEVAKKVEAFLDMYVESVLPKKTIVDYDRMQRLEKLHESLKDLLVVDDAAVEAKKASLDESFKSEKSKCETEVAKMQVKLDEATEHIASLTKKLESLKAVEILESKTKDLPDFEAHAIKRRLCESSEKEIEENFDKTLDEVREDAKKLAEQKDAEEEVSLDSEISKIVGEADEIKEDDLLKARPHNGKDKHNGHIEENADPEALEAALINAECLPQDDPAADEEEEFETIEIVREDPDGNIQLDKDDVIDADLMKLWCNQSIEVK